MQQERIVRALWIGVGLALFASSTATASSNFIARLGVRSATLAWAPSQGIVDGYIVLVSRNGGSPKFEGFATDTQFTVVANYGDSVVVQVQAVGRASIGEPSQASEVSTPTPPIRFFPAASWISNRLATFDCESCGAMRLRNLGNLDAVFEFPRPTGSWRLLDVGYYANPYVAMGAWLDPESGAFAVASLNSPDQFEASETGADMDGLELIGTDDFDGDDVDDFLFYDRTYDEVWVRSASEGGLGFTERVRGVRGNEIVGHADLDDDGRSDVWEIVPLPRREAEVGSDVVLQIWNADASSSLVDSYVVTMLGDVVALGDFDANGIEDLLWRTPEGNLAITYLDGSGSNESTLPVLSANLEVKGVGDLDLAPGIDIVLQDTNNDSVHSIHPGIPGLDSSLKMFDADGPWKLRSVIE